jgi:hypothetical protein
MVAFLGYFQKCRSMRILINKNEPVRVQGAKGSSEKQQKNQHENTKYFSFFFVFSSFRAFVIKSFSPTIHNRNIVHLSLFEKKD